MSTKIILVVDDTVGLARGVARLMARDLSSHSVPHQIRSHEDPADALKRLQEDPPEAAYFLITDGHMPGLNGDELIERMRVALGDRLRHTVVASSDESFRKLAEDVHATLFINGKSMQSEHWPSVRALIEDFLKE